MPQPSETTKTKKTNQQKMNMSSLTTSQPYVFQGRISNSTETVILV